MLEYKIDLSYDKTAYQIVIDDTIPIHKIFDWLLKSPNSENYRGTYSRLINNKGKVVFYFSDATTAMLFKMQFS